jgi:hypothetical protein
MREDAEASFEEYEAQIDRSADDESGAHPARHVRMAMSVAVMAMIRAPAGSVVMIMRHARPPEAATSDARRREGLASRPTSF